MHFLKKNILLLCIVCGVHSAGAQTFTEVSATAGINHFVFSPALIGGGCAFFDYDNDGWQDIYITGGLKRDKLYRNNRDGTFTECGIAAGLYGDGLYYTMGAVAGDIDRDGDRDIFITTWGDYNDWATPVRNILYRNNGNGTFTDIAPQAGITHAVWSVSATMGDYNLDGYLDIYVGNYVDSTAFIFHPVTHQITGFAHTGYADFLYLNNGNSTFTQVAPQFSVANEGTTLAATFTDYDNDQDADIYVANDFGAWVIPNRLYRNEYPLDSFSDVSAASGANAAIYGMGIAPGDFDEDGDLDYYVTNIGRKVLFRNNGNGTFTDVADTAGVTNTYTDSLFTTGWGTVFFDYDNDTWLDLFVSNGQIPAADIIATGPEDPNKLFKNNMNGTFTDISAFAGLSDSTLGRGCATGDYDNDGDLDLLVVCAYRDTIGSAGTHVLLYRNDMATGNHWLKVEVRGTVNNPDGFGTHVEVFAGGRKWLREIDGGSSHASQNSSIAHFGLGGYTAVDSIVVLWPGGSRFTLPNVPVDRLVTVLESGQGLVTEDVYAEICQGDSLFAGGAFQTTTGIFYDTLTASSGIDSVVISHLSVLPSATTFLHYDVCAGDSILLGGIYFYTDTLLRDSSLTSSGCDSVITTEVSFIPRQIAIADAFLCEGDSIFAGGAWQKQAGSYSDTIPGGALCDLIVITAVDLIPATEIDTVEAVICAGDSFFAGGVYQKQEGFYTDTFSVPLFGCDSLLVTHLRSISAVIETRNLNACRGDSVFAQGNYQTVSGTYTDTLTSAAGCDSILISVLRFDSTYMTQIFHTIPEGDSLFTGGTWQTESGTYMDTFISAGGCDSIIITGLLVEPVGAGNIPLPALRLKVFPNPAREKFVIEYQINTAEQIEITLTDISGKKLMHVCKMETTGLHHLRQGHPELSAGIYFIRLRTGSAAETQKLVLQ